MLRRTLLAFLAILTLLLAIADGYADRRNDAGADLPTRSYQPAPVVPALGIRG